MRLRTHVMQASKNAIKSYGCGARLKTPTLQLQDRSVDPATIFESGTHGRLGPSLPASGTFYLRPFSMMIRMMLRKYRYSRACYIRCCSN
jgi:hypothetical protein